MNARSSLAALAALLALVGCNAGDPPRANVQSPDAVNNVARPAAGNAAAPATGNTARPAAASAEGSDQVDPSQAEAQNAEPEPERNDPERVTRAWFAGRWSDTGNCADAGTFEANGTYLLADGTRGMWSVQDGKLFIQHANGRAMVRIRKIDERTVEVVNEQGGAGRSIRC